MNAQIKYLNSGTYEALACKLIDAKFDAHVGPTTRIVSVVAQANKGRQLRLTMSPEEARLLGYQLLAQAERGQQIEYSQLRGML